MSESVSIGSLVLDGVAAGTESKRREPSRPEFDVVAKSGNDFAVRRTCGRSRRLLAAIVSKGQFYIKNEANGDVTPADSRALRSFMRGCGTLDIGVPWLGSLSSEPKFLDELAKCFDDPGFIPTAKSGFWSFDDYIALPHWQRESVAVTGAYFERHCDAFRFLRREMESADGGLRPFILKHGRDLLPVVEKYGIDRARRFIRSVHDAGFQNVASASAFINLLYLPKDADEAAAEVAGTDYKGFLVRPQPATRRREEDVVQLSFDRLLDYLTTTASEEGFLNDMEEFVVLWSDTLLMQVCLYGKVDEKYPKNLLTRHHILMGKYNAVRFEVDERAWSAAVSKFRDCAWNGRGYRIVLPERSGDLKAEGLALGHCVGSYGRKVLAGRSRVLFLRREENPGKPLVTVELTQDGDRWRLSQAKGERNRRVTSEEAGALESWCMDRGFAFAV